MKKVFIKLKNLFSSDIEALNAIDLLEKKYEKLPQKGPPHKEASFDIPKELLSSPQSIALFSDGACRGNPGPGAWAQLGMNAKGEVLFKSTGVSLLTTNNKMELEGAIESLKLLLSYGEENNLSLEDVYLYSDSKYVIEGISKWVPSWKNRGWKKADGKAPENFELWREFDELSLKFQKLEFIWVKGHAGHPQNEECDRLANEALDEAGY